VGRSISTLRLQPNDYHTRLNRALSCVAAGSSSPPPTPLQPGRPRGGGAPGAPREEEEEQGTGTGSGGGGGGGGGSGSAASTRALTEQVISLSPIAAGRVGPGTARVWTVAVPALVKRLVRGSYRSGLNPGYLTGLPPRPRETCRSVAGRPDEPRLPSRHTGAGGAGVVGAAAGGHQPGDVPG
jgi:hypothetical protein